MLNPGRCLVKAGRKRDTHTHREKEKERDQRESEIKTTRGHRVAVTLNMKKKPGYIKAQ